MSSSGPLPDKAQAVAGLKMAQIIQLIKDNQLVTALVVFCAWQIGILADAHAYVGGMC